MCTYHLCFQDFSVNSCRENKVFVKNLEIYSLYLNKSPGTNLKNQSTFKPMSPTLKNKRNKKKEEREIPKCVALTWYFFLYCIFGGKKYQKIVTLPSITEWCSWPFSIKRCAECIKSGFSDHFRVPQKRTPVTEMPSSVMGFTVLKWIPEK